MAGEQAGEGVRPQCDDLLRQAREQLSVLMEEISVDALSVPASKGLASEHPNIVAHCSQSSESVWHVWNQGAGVHIKSQHHRRDAVRMQSRDLPHWRTGLGCQHAVR